MIRPDDPLDHLRGRSPVDQRRTGEQHFIFLLEHPDETADPRDAFLRQSVLVLQGRMRVMAGDSVQDLNEGGSVYIFRQVPHNAQNTGDTPLRFITYMIRA